MAAITALFDNNIDNVAHLFTGIANASTTAKSSPDGVTWTARTLPTSSNWMGLCFGNDTCVATSSTSNTTVAASSIDGGINWIARTLPAAGASRGWYAAAFGNNMFVAVTGGGSTTVAASSPDGLSWTVRTIGSGDWRCVTYGNGVFVALNYGSNTTQISTDGINWISGGNLPTSSNWISITFDSYLNRFVAISNTSGTIGAYCDNSGSTWNSCTLPTSTTWRSICSNNSGLFVAVSNQASSTYAAYSNGGIIWSGSTLPASAQWEGVCYGSGPNVFSATAYSSTNAATSYNGIDWIPQTQANAAFNNVIYAPVSWRSNDTLTINNNARITVNTNQTKFWNAMTITHGELYITNSSTTTGIRFTTGRSSGAAVQAITPGSGLGSIVVKGDWIQIGTGDTTSNQVMITPYSDWIPCVWVETGNTYEMWLNVTGAYGGTLRTYIDDGLLSVYKSNRGKFFVQLSATTQNFSYVISNSTTVLGSRTIIITGNTSMIYPGASISGTGVPSNSIVEKIINATTIEINQASTASASNVTLTFYNPVVEQLTNQIMFGNGTNGNTLLMGQKVKIPNIMLTSDTPANLQTATIVNTSAQVGMSFVLTNGGRVSLDTCLFDEAYHNFNQTQSLSISNVGFQVPPAISEVYDLNINSMGISLPACRRAYSTSWIYRDVRNALQNILPMSYITGAVLNDIAMVTTNVYYATAGSLTAPVGFLNISYSNDLTVSNIRAYSLYEHRGFHNAIALSAAVNNSTFTNIHSYGCPPISLQQSSNNTFTNIYHNDSMFNYSWYYASGSKVTYDPETELDMINNQKYYFKSRTFFTRDRTEYTESRLYSMTPFLATGSGSTIFPDYVTAYPNDNGSILFGWTNRSPVHNDPSYEIHRSTSSGFTLSSSTKCFRTNTAATVTWTQAGNKPTYTSTAATRTLTFNVNKTITVSGSTAVNVINDDFRVGDTLVVTVTTLNNGTYTISGVTANIITVNEDLRTEANAAGFIITSHHIVNKTTITATAARTLTFNVGKTITAGGSTPWSFVLDGYKVGDCFTVSGTASNNGVFTISVVTATIITVLETMVTETTYSADATITPFDITNNTTYYYKLRKYDSVGNYSDSAEIECTPTIPQTNKNLCLRGTSFASPWVASNMTVGAASRISPFQLYATTAANQIADAILLTATNNNATLTQSIPTTSGLTYIFSLYVCNNATITIPTVNGSISMGSTTQNFTANSKWEKISLTHVASSGSTNVVIQINTNGQSIVAIGATVNHNTMKPYLTTAASPVININEVRDISLVRSWCRGYGEATSHSGVELTLAAAITGELHTEIYCSSNRNFTPSILNKIMDTNTSSANSIVLNQSSLNNSFTNFNLVGKSAPQSYGLLYLALSSSNNKFKNFTYDLGGAYMSGFISINTLSNDNLISNWLITNWRNYTTTSNPIVQANNQFAGLTIQNLIMNNSDFPINNIGSNMIIKGMNGANATPANAATTYSLGSTSDGIAIAYTAVYDTIFNELYFTTTKGALHILFNASSKETKPYVLSGITSIPVFANSGKLYMRYEGDTIEYTWPHKIIGVSGFRNLAMKLSGLDLGTTTDRLEGLKIEYDVNTGSGYSGWKEARIGYDYTGSTGLAISGETVSASDGFYLKLKITAMLGMKYNTRSAGKNFIVGEIIKGSTSLVQATVVRDVITTPGTNGTGTLWLSGLTGTFRTGEALVRSSDSDARATNVATNTVYATFPSFSSYIDGLQLNTNINYSNLYPAEQITLSLTGLQLNSEIRIFNHGTTTELDGIENSSTLFDFKYVYNPNTYVDIVILALGYQYYRIDNYLLSSTDSTIPIQQIIDRVYENQ